MTAGFAATGTLIGTSATALLPVLLAATSSCALGFAAVAACSLSAIVVLTLLARRERDVAA